MLMFNNLHAIFLNTELVVLTRQHSWKLGVPGTPEHSAVTALLLVGKASGVGEGSTPLIEEACLPSFF